MAVGGAFPQLLAAATSVTAATANPTMWYTTRAAAVCAYIALTLTCLLGIVRSLMRVSRFRRTWLIEEIHQYVADAAVIFVAVHLTTLLLDPLTPFAPVNLLLPIGEPYRSLAVALASSHSMRSRSSLPARGCAAGCRTRSGASCITGASPPSGSPIRARNWRSCCH